MSVNREKMENGGNREVDGLVGFIGGINLARNFFVTGKKIAVFLSSFVYHCLFLRF